MNIDPEAAAAEFRERVLGPYRGVLPQETVSGIEEQLSGACTVEVAAFDEFTALLGEENGSGNDQHVVFDTALTGHTLRLLRLPAARNLLRDGTGEDEDVWRRASSEAALPEGVSGLEALVDALEARGNGPVQCRQNIVFLAVHPPVVASVMPDAKPALEPEAIFVSLAPKLTIVKLSEMPGGFRRIARVIPNAPSIVGKGYNPMAFGDALGEGDRAVLRKLLDGPGDGVEVPEALLEVYAVVSAMGPTFVWPQHDMLASLACGSGLTQQAAWDGIERCCRAP